MWGCSEERRRDERVEGMGLWGLWVVGELKKLLSVERERGVGHFTMRFIDCSRLGDSPQNKKLRIM